MKLGDIRVRELRHPDGLGVTIWEVEQAKKSIGKYAKKGQLHWSNVNPCIEPFTSERAAINHADNLKARL